MSTVIRVENLSKSYRLGEIGFGSFREHIEQWWHRRSGNPSDVSEIPVLPGDEERVEDDLFWALRDVSFEVQKGSIIGIIGKNGAGKSTLLKILSRITDPTGGRAELHGKVSSLLEVGTGFHQELTGRENVYLSGSILGMTRREIDENFDAIVEFAEIGGFIDTPVKRYSSGMHVRLGFAVAAHLDPEILIVDEVLAVGDAEFQKKCLGKMGNVSERGRTILFVSHNMAAVNNLCRECIWLDKGRMRMRGPTGDVVHAYLEGGATSTETGEVNLENWPNRYGSGEARIVSACLIGDTGEVTAVVRRSRSMAIEFLIDSRSREPLHLSVQVVADTGERILHMSNWDTDGFRPGALQGRYRVRFELPMVPLSSGSYTFILGLHAESSSQPIDVLVNVLPFRAEDVPNSPRPYKTVARNSFCWVPTGCSVSKA